MSHNASEPNHDDTEDEPEDSAQSPPQENSFAAEAAAAIAGDEGSSSHEVVNIGGTASDSPSQSAQNVGPDLSDIDLDDLDADWVDYFPHETPYKQQVDAIQRCLDTVGKGGYQMLEGACGTGKTLIALIASIELIENYDKHIGSGGPKARLSTEPERVLAVTSVKQQLRQFIEEVQAINGALSDLDTDRDLVKGLVLRGKSDMLPYAQASTGPFAGSASTQQASSDLRDRTYDLIKKGSNVKLNWPKDLIEHCSAEGCTNHVQGDAVCLKHGSEEDKEESDRWYDPARAQAVATRASEIEGGRLTIEGVETPYPEEIPHTTQVSDQSKQNAVPLNAQGLFDPFYAGFFAGEKRVPFYFDAGEGNVLDGPTILREAASAGICPHSAMSKLIEKATVVLGNFNHLFDPDTRHLTEEILTDETLTIVDEAHNLEERVRDTLSDTVSMHALRQAHRDIVTARQYFTDSYQSELEGDSAEEAHDQAQQAVAGLRGSLSSDDFDEALHFLQWLMDKLDGEVSSHLEEEYGDWRSALSNQTVARHDQEIQLQEPTDNSADRVFLDSLTADSGFSGAEMWYDIVSMAGAVVAIHDMVDESDRMPIIGGVAETLNKWRVETHTEYFREIELEYSPKETGDATLPDWAGTYNASYYLYNCIPSQKLAAIFEELGGGILMSATLEPFDIYSEVSGLHALETGSVAAVDDHSRAGVQREGQPTAPARIVENVQYGLAFPRENRASFVVDVPKFTHDNRGKPVQSYGSMTPVRQTYTDILYAIAQSYGNTLICLPSYSESRWAAAILEQADAVSKPVLQDMSSGASFTDELLEEFFSGEPSILTTSLRGTVTEGVDYKGERLHSCAVVGVPYINTRSPQTKAVMTAYDENLEEAGSGFKAAIQVPAVRKARQAFGRVIRGFDEVGTRILVDGRYIQGTSGSVNDYLGSGEQSEFETVRHDALRERLDEFWSTKDTC